MKYAIQDFIPSEYLVTGPNDTHDGCCGGEISDRRVEKEIARAQQIIEETYATMRRTLRNYSALVEKQRREIRGLRDAALLSNELPEPLLSACETRIEKLETSMEIETLNDILSGIFLSALDEFLGGAPRPCRRTS